jgi:outer membrane protein OmpA-like peptidoglycan-associated protein
MATNLIELLTKEFGGETLGKLAGLLGEPEGKVQAAVGGVAPALVAALANKASTGTGLTDLFSLMKSGGFDGSQTKSLGSLLGAGGGMTDLLTKGAPLAASLLGGRQTGLIDWLASFAGIGSKSAGSLLSMAAPTVLSLIGGSMSKGGGFSQAVLGQLLGGQGAFLKNLPSGLTSALGITDLSKLGVVPAPVAPKYAEKRVIVPEKKTNWWPWIILGLLALLALWWFLGRGPAGTIDPRVSILNDEGKILCSAAVRDDSTKNAILASVKKAFGESTACDITVDPNVKAIGWLPNLDKVIASLRKPGTDFQLNGSSLTLGGWLNAADRKAIGDELRGYLDPSISLGEGADKAAAAIADAKNKALAALGALGTSFTAEAFTSAMNLAVINFATGSAEIPADSKDLIDRAAAILKTAPKGTAIEIGGHTDNTGDSAANQKLSEDRANAVRNAIVAAGADGAALVAKGYGDTKPVASNDTEYGRFRNRRIEYSIPAAPAK